MIFRTYHEETLYEIEAPEGSKVVFDGDGAGELALFEERPGGLAMERRLPTSVVVKASQRGYLGLAILEGRAPRMHTEAALAGPVE